MLRASGFGTFGRLRICSLEYRGRREAAGHDFETWVKRAGNLSKYTGST